MKFKKGALVKYALQVKQPYLYHDVVYIVTYADKKAGVIKLGGIKGLFNEKFFNSYRGLIADVYRW